jgi:hypothetical protein
MTIAFRSADDFAAHAVCVAAGVRDGMRATQFYVRDLSRADAWGKSHAGGATFLSVQVARLARLADRFMTWSANVAIALFLPSWRKLPSPFAPGMMSEIATAIRRNSLFITRSSRLALSAPYPSGLLSRRFWCWNIVSMLPAACLPGGPGAERRHFFWPAQ